jgi:SNF2 family DNA or RNA helicase
VTGARDSARLHELLSPYMSRVLKKDVLKDRKEPLFDRFRLPPRKIDLSEVGAEEIARIAELLDGDFDLSELENDPAVTSLRKLLGVSKALEVGDLIVDEARNTGAKQLVFYHHTDVGMSIFKLLHGEGLKPVIYNGNSTAKQKQMALHLFKNDPECLVFIGQMDASGTGLDGLQVASRVHIVEEPWTPAKLDQVVSRADRGGQLGQVHVTSYVIAGSYDEKVSKKIEERTRIINAVIDGHKEGKAA